MDHVLVFLCTACYVISTLATLDTLDTDKFWQTSVNLQANLNWEGLIL